MSEELNRRFISLKTAKEVLLWDFFKAKERVRTIYITALSSVKGEEVDCKPIRYVLKAKIVKNHSLRKALLRTYSFLKKMTV